MSTPAKRRLVRDFRRLQQDPPAGITGCPMEDDLMQWQAVIFGPDDTPWEGGTFKLQMNFDEDYPNKPPKVKFLTKIFHPNVYANGQICLDILQSQWSPIYDVAAVLTSIQSLLSDPNPSSPANVEAAKLYTENRREYERKVSEYVQSSWELDAQEIDKLNKEKLEGGGTGTGGGNINNDNASSSNNNPSSTTNNNNDSSIPSSTNPPSSSPST